MIRIAQAASSEVHTKENPGTFGTPPNQLRTGVTADKPYGNLDGELNIIPFYASGWQAVFRAKDPKIAEKIATLAEKAVMNWQGVGYGQNMSGPWNEQRTGYFDALNAMVDPDPLKIKTPVNCDCSSKVGAEAYFAGVYEPSLRTANTTTLPARLMGTGQFVRLEDKGLLERAEGCLRGDIFWRPGHVITCLDDGVVETTPMVIGNCSACNFRTGPGKENSIIRTLHPGDIVFKISTSGSWSQIRFEDTYGYVSSQFLKDLPTATVTGQVWLRSEPGYNWQRKPIGDPLIVIPNGTDECYLTGRSSKHMGTVWYECAYSGFLGWASGMYIKA